MNKLKLYLNESKKNSSFLDEVTQEFKKETIRFINDKFINPNIKDIQTAEKLGSNLNKFIKDEFNTLVIPHYQILENINLCIELEIRKKIQSKIDSQKFGEKKFTEILENGLQRFEPTENHLISEKKFVDSLVSFTKGFTQDIDDDGEFLKIEFN
jgi:hypothetical protein